MKDKRLTSKSVLRINNAEISALKRSMNSPLIQHNTSEKLG
jgi:hypothetical protein